MPESSQMDHAVTVRIDERNDLLKRKVSFVKQKMKEEMDPAWKDFFKKNPDKKEEDVWRRLEERLRSKQNSKDDDKEAYTLGRREKIAPLILKRRIWWEPVPEASSYVVYVSKNRTIFDPAGFSWETTPGIISRLVIGKTELVIPDEWPEFPTEFGTYYIGITSRDDIGNQSDPFLLSGQFKFLAPSAPLRGGIGYL
jgi:hypothetical protein